jgi:hypothetical protein
MFFILHNNYIYCITFARSTIARLTMNSLTIARSTIDYELPRVNIDKSTLHSSILLLLLSGIINTAYTINYVQIPELLKTDILSRLFLTYIISSWLMIIFLILEILRVNKYYGANMPMILWIMTRHTNRISSFVSKSSTNILVGIGIYFLIMNNWFDNCGIFSDPDASNTCNSIRLIVILTIIEIVFLGLAFGIVCTSYQEDLTRICKFILSMCMYRYSPYQYALFKTSCSVCLESKTIFSTKKMITLNCGHYFHVTCISEWFKYHKTCPMCQSRITALDKYFLLID